MLQSQTSTRPSSPSPSPSLPGVLLSTASAHTQCTEEITKPLENSSSVERISIIAEFHLHFGKFIVFHASLVPAFPRGCMKLLHLIMKPYIMKPFHTFEQPKSQLRYLGSQSPPSTFKHSNALGFLELPLLTKQLSVNFPSHFGGNETRFFAIPLQFSLSRSQRTQLTHTSPTFPPLVYRRLLTSHIYICAGCAYHPNLKTHRFGRASSNHSI